ncbi:lysylphosphatidylglycerol synthase transmembrane domain-containing protein [Marivirga salinae]|uniref:Lysylphosphatidylglycerol synthase transmembrane domain-containing protein n=1 Tax=Marivirga salinarum TaxID=3059078 RepID=A0AA51NBP0_9BACT|nr:lysylphosphatidylglycerol synthase transmembrane domain-containing protein [Marivirga sp. BDSF4-3]WMN12065.1 lysylphosphatidylglycerol synthase transmembrane domain-containing protein [Marivirga sp. BDSF4-3]
MRKGLQSFLKYTLSLAIAALLFWYLYKDVDFNEMMERFRNANLIWIYLSIALAMFSHLLRAWRWNMLLEPMGYHLKTSRTFLAVMVGYLANFVVPRMGEVSRCGILKNTDNVSVSRGFGSVVTERIFDMICLLLIVAFTLIIEFRRLKDFFLNLFLDKATGLEENFLTLMIVGVTFLIGGIVIFFLLKRNQAFLRKNKYFNKLTAFLRQLVEGITSVRKLKKPGLFWITTIGIWVCYYFMTYVMFFSMEPTSNLGFSAGFILLVLGGIGMAAPVQGGIGAFHYLVGAGLLLYGVAEKEGIIFAFILHTTNSIAIIVVGSISLFISMIIPKRNSNQAYANS